jgi:dienelactone hydrolase
MQFKPFIRRLNIFAFLVLLLAACGGQPDALSFSSAVTITPPQPAADLAATTAVSPIPTALSPAATNTPIPTDLPTSTPQPTASATASSTPSPVPSSTPDPYAAYTIESLIGRSYGGGELELIERLEVSDKFARYLISYPSDGLTIYGFMNVPHEGSKFPVAIVLHGYINPASYETLDYTTRYADVLAEAGYFVVHPNLRGFPPSSEGDDAYRTGLAVDVLNLVTVIREQSSDPEGPLRRADPQAIHLWGHSMGGGAVLRVATILNKPYLRAAVLYGAMSGDERLNYEKILEWSGGSSGAFELAAPSQTLAAISPINYLDRITAAISIHHGEGDETVPPQWSADLCARLQALDKPVECFSYHAAPHTFHGEWEELFNRRVIEFFNRY